MKDNLFYFSIVLIGAIVFCFGIWLSSFETKTSNVKAPLYTDPETGCEYLTPFSNSGAFTPRLDGNGKQLGCKK